MPKRTSIGVDIGSSAVRAAEVVIEGRSSQLVRFAQVGLEAGSVVEGEVRDQAAVGAALKRLWSEGGFKRRDVVLGVSSQRAMVRLLDMPAVTHKELRSALRYEIGELLPIPLEQAVFDFAVLGSGRPIGDGGQTTQVLVVVAQKDIVRDGIAAARRAGLRVRAVDAAPLALLRAVPGPEDPQALDAVVSLGAQLAVVALRQGGAPRFMRTTTIGAEVEPAAKVTAGSRLVAPSLRADNGSGGPRPETVVEEVRGSIEFFLSHAQGVRLDRVQLTGGGAFADRMGDRLASALGVPVVPAALTPTCERSVLGLSDAQFEEASHRWATAVGLALWGTQPGQIPSLLPPEIAERDKQRRIIAMAGAGVLVVAAGLGLLSHGRVESANNLNAQAVVEQQQAATVLAEVGKLGTLTQAEQAVQARRGLAEQALSSDIAWVKLERSIQKALPAGTSITSIDFTNAPPSALGQFIGSVTATMTAKGGLPAEAAVVKALASVPQLATVWVSQSTTNSSNGVSVTNAQSSPGASGASTATFSVTAAVTADALSNRASQLPGEHP